MHKYHTHHQSHIDHCVFGDGEANGEVDVGNDDGEGDEEEGCIGEKGR